jgi:excinuclease ABC subunit C
MITYIEGEKDKKQSKLFKIKSKDLGDVPNMKECLYRHFSKLNEKDFPNLLVLDGGKAQLNCAIEVLDQLNVITVDIISISKEDAKHTKSLTKEKVFIKDEKEPIELDFKSPLLFLLQKIRDDAHISAISFHKKRRSKSIFRSSLDDIKGIGKVKKQKLLKHFKSVENIKKAKLEDLKNLDFLNKKDISNLLKLK